MRKIKLLLILFPVLLFGLFSSVVANELEVDAKSHILLDAVSNTVLNGEEYNLRTEPASTTKIMTIILALEALAEGRISLDDMVRASHHAHEMGGSQIWLEIGESMSVQDLLASIAIHSANDASVAIAEHIAGTEAAFVELMNQKARELGMSNTQYKNCHGLSAEGHYTTAYDLGILGAYAISNTNIQDYCTIWEYWLRDEKTWLVNRNKLISNYPGILGIKTGYTDKAGHCIVAAAHSDGLDLVAVVLGSPTSAIRFEEARKLLDYGFSSYHTSEVIKAGEVVRSVEVKRGRQQFVDLVSRDEVLVTAVKGETPIITLEVLEEHIVTAPMSAGQKVGEAAVMVGGEEYVRIDLLLKEDVKKGNAFYSVWQVLQYLLLPFHG